MAFSFNVKTERPQNDITCAVWTDDNKLLQELKLTAAAMQDAYHVLFLSI